MRFPLNRAICPVIALGWTFAPAALQAQRPLPRGQEAADTFELEEIVVTATRLPTPREALTASVTVITRDELRSRGIGYILDVLRSVTGGTVVQTASFGGTTSLFLRGGESDYVQVLMDGVPLNRPGGAFDFATLTTDNIERIEIVRGPASVLYGSDAVTGVVQIFSRVGRGAPSAALGLRAGTFGSVAWQAELSAGNEAVSYALSLSRFTTDGALAFNNDFRNTVLAGHVRVRPDERTDASLSVRLIDDELHVPTDGAGRLVDRNAFQTGDGLSLGLEVGRFFTERLEARVLLAANDADGGFDDRPDGAADTLGFFAFRSLEDVRRLSADLRANLYLSAMTVLTVGAEIEQEKQRTFSESESEFGKSSGSFDAERLNRAYYAQAVAQLAARVSLSAGARVEDNDAFGTFTTYRTGVAYRWPNGFRVRATLGTGFKEPTFFENFASGFVRGNPDLDPERSRSWEVGIEQPVLGRRLLLSATYFNQRFRDLIQFTFGPPVPEGPNFFNVGEADAAGIELEARVSAAGPVALTANYTYLDTEVIEAGPEADVGFAPGQPLLRRPRHAANLSLGFRRFDRGRANLDVVYVGKRDDLDFTDFPAVRVELPDYVRLDVAGEFRLLERRRQRPGLTATARIENLLDRSYQEVRNFPARGLTVFVGGRIEFGP